MIRVQLVDTSGESLRVPDVLVGLNILRHGRYYYGNLIGLTNASGLAQVDGSEIEDRFDHDRALFPSDYKTELADCDEQIEVAVLSRKELEEARAAVTESYFVPPETKDLYARAVNTIISGGLARVDTTLADDQPYKISLQAGISA